MAATCQWCHHEMTPRGACTVTEYAFSDGQTLNRIRFGSENPVFDPCPDCNTARGEFHHAFCDMEECPRCHGQAISCGCLPTPCPESVPPSRRS